MIPYPQLPEAILHCQPVINIATDFFIQLPTVKTNFHCPAEMRLKSFPTAHYLFHDWKGQAASSFSSVRLSLQKGVQAALRATIGMNVLKKLRMIIRMMP